MNKTTEALKPTMQYVNGKDGLTYHCWVAYRPLDAIDDLEKYIAGQTQASFVYEDQAKWFCKQFNDAIAQGLEPFEETSGGGFKSRLASPKSALKLAEEALHNTGNALVCLTTTRNLRPMYQEMRDDAVEGCNEALAAIREVLAEPDIEEMTLTQIASRYEPMKQEPVAVISESAIGLVKLHSNGACLPFGTQLYAAPVERQWVDLTQDEMWDVFINKDWTGEPLQLMSAVIAAFKEKNT